MNPPARPSELPLSNFPADSTLFHATKLAMELDKPIYLDYFLDTLSGKAFLGEDITKERVLVKSPEEFTTVIKKLYKVAEDFIVITENSIYIVSGKLVKRRIKSQ